MRKEQKLYEKLYGQLHGNYMFKNKTRITINDPQIIINYMKNYMVNYMAITC